MTVERATVTVTGTHPDTAAEPATPAVPTTSETPLTPPAAADVVAGMTVMYLVEVLVAEMVV